MKTMFEKFYVLCDQKNAFLTSYFPMIFHLGRSISIFFYFFFHQTIKFCG